jgi:protein KIBRA
MDYKQKGVETLHNVNVKFIESGHGLTIEEATAIRTELLNIQQSLSTGEQEKIELMKSLACLKDDLTRLQPSESSLDVSAINAHEKLSTASQTDLSGEMVPIGARLAELARLRLQYDESRRNVQEIQQQLAALEERISPGQLESDQDRLLLIQEKEQLLRELRSINSRNRSKSEMNDVKMEIRKLESDLNNAMEVSNKCIADRLKIHEDKQFLLQQLKDSMRSVSALESQLKLLSASTLSMSSSSSLGSLSSSHASSKGSLSSLSFTDIYGMSTTAQPDSSMLDLHRRVEKILEGTQARHNVDNNQNSEETFVQASDVPVNLTMPKTSSQLSLSPRSSLSSVSPPVSPYEAVLPPSYDQAYLTSVERQKKLQASLPVLAQSNNSSNLHLEGVSSVATLEDNFSGLNLSRQYQPGSTSLSTTHSPMRRVPPSQPYSRPGTAHFELGDLPYSLAPSAILLNRRSGQDSVGSDQSAPLSPISETTTDDRKTISSNARSVSAAVSDESVAGDSGVFEASHKKEDLGLSMNLETAQVQIKLRYSVTDDLLHVGIERARNLSALFIPEGRKVCIKAALLPSIANVLCTFCTRAITDLSKPTFGENFPIAIAKHKLIAKTLQVNIWAVDANHKEDCLGSAQVSMADFKSSTTSVKWYNVLSFHFMQPEVKKPVQTLRTAVSHIKQESEISSMTSSRQGTLKEESSDESTIISSQTSTLTRNIGPESMMGHCDNPEIGYLGQAEFAVEGGISFQVDNEEEEDSDDDEFMINENTDSFIFPTSQALNVDAETNTECVFIQQPVIGRKPSKEENLVKVGPSPGSVGSSVVKRSKTFSPSAPISKSQYNCRLNRSDSDSAMPLYRRMPFQRSSKERRSLHVPTTSHHRHKSQNKNPHSDVTTKTSIDLELDLAAQQSKLMVLSEEIERLRQIKTKMEEAKAKGDKELPLWFQEDEKFQILLASLEEKTGQKSYEEKRMEKLLRKTAKEIYKLRKTKSIKGQLDVQSFKEKMAFFTCVKANVPIYGEDSDDDTGSESSTLQSAVPSRQMVSSNFSTPTPTVTEEHDDHTLKEGLSTETVNTITEDDGTAHSSQNSTPTPTIQSERFSYEVDPELGAFV